MKYEFTLTLKPLMYQYTPQQQYDQTKDILYQIFYPNNQQKYQVTCVAELTQEHNVHYHCIIELEGLLDKDKLINKFRTHSKTFGKKSLTQVKYEDSYKKYIIKNLSETKLVIKDPVLCDHYGLCSMKFQEEIQDKPAEIKK